jgi:hypothetical protein
LEHFICEIIKPIKRRSIKAALNKNKSINKILCVHTTAEQCLYQFLRDGKCHHGQNPYSCKEFKEWTNGVDLEQIASGLRVKLKDSIVLKYREQAEQNKVINSTDTQEVFTKPIPFPPIDKERKRVSSAGIVNYIWFDPKTDKVTKTKKVKVKTHGSKLNQVATGGGRTNQDAPKSLCTKCGEWVQYPHDPENLEVTCWLCVAKGVLEYENKKPETSNTKTKESKPNGKRTSIPRRKKSGRRTSRT